MKTYEECKREFVKKIEKVDYSKHTYEVFRDWLEVSAILCHQAPYWSGDFEIDEDFERLEIVFKEVESRYQPDRFQIFAELFGLITIALNDKFGDFLGEVFMGLDFGDKWRGQFFTPYSLSLMMATLTFGEPEKATKPILVSDPTSGAAVILENDRPGGLMANFRFRLAVMIGLVKIEKLDKSEVYQTFDECIRSVSQRF